MPYPIYFYPSSNNYTCYVCSTNGAANKGVFQTGLPSPHDWICIDCLVLAVNAGKIVLSMAGANPVFDHPNIPAATNMIDCEECGEEFDHTQSGMIRCSVHIPPGEELSCTNCGDTLQGNWNYCSGCGDHDSCHQEDDCSSSCNYCGNGDAYCGQHTECEECGSHIENAYCVEHRNVCHKDDCGITVDPATVFCKDHQPKSVSGFAINDDGGIELDNFEVRFS